MRIKKWVGSEMRVKLVLVAMAVAAGASILYTSKVFRQRQQLLTVWASERNKLVSNAVLVTNFGRIRVQLNGEAERAKDNFVRLAREGFYEGLRFHRVVNGFAIQTGDPQSRDVGLVAKWGSGGAGYTVERDAGAGDEIGRGSVIVAHEGVQDSGSQFMILVTDAPWLAGQNTVLGQVVEGMGVVDAISGLASGVTGVPAVEVVLVGVELE